MLRVRAFITLGLVWATMTSEAVKRRGGAIAITQTPAIFNDTIVAPQPGERHADREYILAPGENITEKIRKNLFVKVHLSKPNCYLGEPIAVSYKLYSRLISKSTITRHPSLSGFSVYDMVSPIASVKSVEEIQGKFYQVHLLKKAQLIPLRTGNIALEPIEINNRIHFIKRTPPDSMQGTKLQDLLKQLGDEEKAPAIDKAYSFTSPKLSVSVMPLPSTGAPPDFDGAVGNYTIDAAIVSENITAEDVVVLQVVITGNGNIPLVGAPIIPWPGGIDTLDIRSSEQTDVAIVPLQGTKTFEYQFIPRKAGEYRIPPVSFSFFNPGSHSYQTISSKAISFRAAAGNKDTQRKADKPPTPGAGTSSSKWIGLEPAIWVADILLLSILALWLWRRNKRVNAARETRRAMIAAQQATAAEKEADAAREATRLDAARNFLAHKDLPGFYRELSRVIWMVLAEKTGLPPSNLNKETVMFTLNAMQVSEEMLSNIDEILVACESNLYSPESRQSDATALLQKTELVIAGFRAGLHRSQ